MMRDLIYAALSGDTLLKDALGVGTRIYPSGSLGVDPIPAEPDLPYIQWGFDDETPYREVRETGGTMRRMLRLWVYDSRGDFMRIDAIHARLRNTVEGLTGQVSPSGTQCTEATRVNLGGDLTDNIRSLGVKQASYRIVSQ